MIISASRRTDIPAFYSEWFMNAVKRGFLLIRNPFNFNQVKRVSMLPEDVSIIVFWTRNPEKLIQYFGELDTIGHKYYFQYTITGYHRKLEKSVPNPNRAINIFSKVSDLLGNGKVVWRYDPILLSNYTSIDEHKRLFSKIAKLLAGKTKRVVISFADFYAKTKRNLNIIEGIEYSDILLEKESTLLELASFMVDVATSYGMKVTSCSEGIDLNNIGIEHGKCIDEKLIYEEFKLKLSAIKDKGQREECGCVKSIDIGQYNTCLHGCSYCYANFSKQLVNKNWQLHDPNSPFLIESQNNDKGELNLLTANSNQIQLLKRF